VVDEVRLVMLAVVTLNPVLPVGGNPYEGGFGELLT
jgi:hypothetical protein